MAFELWNSPEDPSLSLVLNRLENGKCRFQLGANEAVDFDCVRLVDAVQRRSVYLNAERTWRLTLEDGQIMISTPTRVIQLPGEKFLEAISHIVEAGP